MIVLDTHAWVWLAADRKKLSARAGQQIGKASRLAVCTISLWEVAMLVQHGRLRFDRDLEVWFEQACSLPRVELIPLSPTIAARIGKLGSDFYGDPADRMIAATALTHRAKLITKDRRLRDCAALTCVW